MRHSFHNRFCLWVVTLLASSTTAFAQERDEPLRQLFVASDAVVAVEVRIQPIGTTQGELFEYLPDVKVVEVFKWDVPGVAKAEGKLEVRIAVEKEHAITDFSKGKQVVLFLEVERLKSGVTFVTIDNWFSVQLFTAGLRRALDRIVADQVIVMAHKAPAHSTSNEWIVIR